MNLHDLWLAGCFSTLQFIAIYTRVQPDLQSIPRLFRCHKMMLAYGWVDSYPAIPTPVVISPLGFIYLQHVILYKTFFNESCIKPWEWIVLSFWPSLFFYILCVEKLFFLFSHNQKLKGVSGKDSLTGICNCLF